MKLTTQPLIAMVGAIACLNPAIADESLLKRKGCFTCHHMEKKVIGPSFSSIAARYSANDIPMLADRLINGNPNRTSGGPPCIPHKNMPSDDAHRIISSIISPGSSIPPKVTKRPPASSIGRGTFEM